MESAAALLDIIDNPAVIAGGFVGLLVIALLYAALFGWCAGGLIADWRAKKPFRIRHAAKAAIALFLAYGSRSDDFNFAWIFMLVFTATFYFHRRAQIIRRDKAESAEEWIARQEPAAEARQ